MDGKFMLSALFSLDSNQNSPNTSKASISPPTAFDTFNDSEVQNDRALLDLLAKLDDFTPVIPEELTEHFLMKAGVQWDDAKLKKLLALLAQKFISDVATDALQFNRIKQQNSQLKDKRKDKKITLTPDDLIAALADYGINIKKPSYFM